MGISIVVTSGKGGVGKTTTTANVSSVLASLGKKVCMVDLDIGLRNLDAVLGLTNRIVYDIVDVAQNRVVLSQALVRDPRFENNLYLLAASQFADKYVLDQDSVKRIITYLKQRFDFVMIDCPAGIEYGFQNAVTVADGAIVVTNPELASVSDADRVVGILESMKMPITPHLIINRVRKNMINEGTSMRIDDIVNHLRIPLLGVVVDEDEVIAASNSGRTVISDKNSDAGHSYRNIAHRMLGENVSLDLFNDTKKTGFFSKLFGRGK
ncbi:septum site-determining protein MinD [Companilactobacillus allii]|uniref:Septum site-determining protein MinD n=1 Tax=Companilactobacillus allii TaxID=1847728 RepID=A0A1P8Q5C1_9LACO|nr:septum site-determining protein MinD [Companilactobacillus allii]APX73060.1 septum site-determining protein MinD [Companilactobacillus allii]USQ67860.1 septum site-determining protein MinD [Companilactobacillus allii]